MKTATTSTDLLLKALDLQLRAILKQDIDAFKQKKQNINQGNLKQAA